MGIFPKKLILTHYVLCRFPDERDRYWDPVIRDPVAKSAKGLEDRVHQQTRWEKGGGR